MKFTTYLREGAPRLAVVDGTDLIDLNDAQPQVPADLRAALRASINLQAAAGIALNGPCKRQALASAKLAPLVPEPGKIICLGLNYFDHAREGGRDKPEYPWFFFRGASSLIAHGDAGVVLVTVARPAEFGMGHRDKIVNQHDPLDAGRLQVLERGRLVQGGVADIQIEVGVGQGRGVF